MPSLNSHNRFRLGLILNFNANWMGGIIYILNLIKTLDFLLDKEKPEIILFYSPGLKSYIEQIKYPYFSIIEWHFPSLYKGYMQSLILGRNVFISKILQNFKLDGLYPVQDFPLKTKTDTMLVSWYADLQHKHYPEFFSRRKIIEREIRIRFMLRNCNQLVASSTTVKNDFSFYYRLRNTLDVHVFRFSSVIGDLDDHNLPALLQKHNLPSDYYLISNQFHKHKNHIVVLQALELIKGNEHPVHIAMTGLFPDILKSPYLKELHELISQQQLETNVTFLGVIPRNEQLLLMKNARAVIQPSLFEGWSTVIEDAKSLQVPVIASDIQVNIEQLGDTGIYFNPHSPSELASILKDYPGKEPGVCLYADYDMRLRQTAENFMEIFAAKLTA